MKSIAGFFFAALLALVLLAATSYAQAVPAPPVQGVSAPDPGEIVGQPAGKPLEGEPLERETKRVASLLRCPVCQGLSVFDSPAEMARNMKIQVRELVARGYTEEQILRYFETSYGEFVRLEPQARGVNWLVWILPVAALALGLFLVRNTLRPKAARSRDLQGTAEVDGSPMPDRQLEPYLAEVRAMVNAPEHGTSETKAENAGVKP